MNHITLQHTLKITYKSLRQASEVEESDARDQQFNDKNCHAARGLRDINIIDKQPIDYLCRNELTVPLYDIAYYSFLCTIVCCVCASCSTSKRSMRKLLACESILVVAESWVLYECSVLQQRRSLCLLSYYCFHQQMLKNLVRSIVAWTAAP